MVIIDLSLSVWILLGLSSLQLWNLTQSHVLRDCWGNLLFHLALNFCVKPLSVEQNDSGVATEKSQNNFDETRSLNSLLLDHLVHMRGTEFLLFKPGSALGWHVFEAGTNSLEHIKRVHLPSKGHIVDHCRWVNVMAVIIPVYQHLSQQLVVVHWSVKWHVSFWLERICHTIVNLFLEVYNVSFSPGCSVNWMIDISYGFLMTGIGNSTPT